MPENNLCGSQDVSTQDAPIDFNIITQCQSTALISHNTTMLYSPLERTAVIKIQSYHIVFKFTAETIILL